MVKTRNKTYWRNRFSGLEESLNSYGQDTYRKIEPAFNRSQGEIQKEIDAWYGRLAKNNNVSIQDARKLLNANELKEFKWSVEDYINYGQKNAINQQWMKQLENASAKHHISRLEALKINTQQSLEVAFGNELDQIDDMARTVFQDGYYKTMFEVQKGFGIGFDVATIDQNKLNKIISSPWTPDGKNFSSRIWNAKTSMVGELHQELTRMAVLGESPDKAIDRLSKFVDKKYKNVKQRAGALVMTEQAFFASASTKDALKELGVEEFEIVATLDTKTSVTCQEMDGNHYPMKDYEVGVTAPPFHVWCRTHTCPYFDDEFSIGERAARDEDGKTYYVSSDMKYPEWKETFVDKDKTPSNYATIGVVSGIIKNIEMPPSVGEIKTITDDIVDGFKKEISKLEDMYYFRIDDVVVEALEDNRIMLQFDSIPNGYTGKYNLIINSNHDYGGSLEAFSNSISDEYKTGFLAAKDIKGIVAHDIAHFITMQNKPPNMTVVDYIKKIESEEFVAGVSRYSDIKKDGFESIAEAFVRHLNGEEISTEAQDLLERYIFIQKVEE